MGKTSTNQLQTDIENDMEEVFVPTVIQRCATTKFHGTSRKIPTVKHNQVISNRETVKRRNSCIQHRKKREARCSRYYDLNDTIIID